MSKFVKPNNDRVFYLFSNQASQKTEVGSKTVEWRWDIPDITLNDYGKLQLVQRTYKTLDVASTKCIITRILNISHKDSIDTSRGSGAILDVSYWNTITDSIHTPAIIVSPQTINNITISVSDDITSNAGITSTNVFCIILKLTEDDRDVVQFGNTNDVNVNQRQILYK